MKTLTIWLLAGALAASLQWNLYDAPAETPEAEGASVLQATPQCNIDPAALGLSDEQAQALGTLCRASSSDQNDFEERADLKLAELRTRLGDDEIDVDEMRALVREVSGLREQALEACVDSVLRVRDVLDQGQVKTLMDSCCTSEIDVESAESCER